MEFDVHQTSQSSASSTTTKSKDYTQPSNLTHHNGYHYQCTHLWRQSRSVYLQLSLPPLFRGLTTHWLLNLTEMAGIGKGFLEHYLRRPHHTVIAALRDITSPNAKALLKLPAGKGSRVILVKIEATSTTDSFDAVNKLEAQGITKLDVIIANAAIVGNQGPVESIDPKAVADVYVINAAGPALLFMGLKSLLERAENPKWMAMSSAVASIEDYQKYMFFKMFPYNASKAALNHFTKTIHAEYENIIAFAVSPG